MFGGCHECKTIGHMFINYIRHACCVPSNRTCDVARYISRRCQKIFISIHPAYCSCKTICSAGCYAKSACENYKEAVKSICALLIPMADWESILACKSMAEDDLSNKDELMPSSRTQKVKLSFVNVDGFNGT